MKFSDRPLAITDVETTGLDFAVHEILEIGLVLADQQMLKVLDTWEIKVKPEHTETADPIAFQINGYDPARWGDAVSLREAMPHRALAGALKAHEVMKTLLMKGKK